MGNECMNQKFLKMELLSSHKSSLRCYNRLLTTMLQSQSHDSSISNHPYRILSSYVIVHLSLTPPITTQPLAHKITHSIPHQPHPAPPLIPPNAKISLGKNGPTFPISPSLRDHSRHAHHKPETNPAGAVTIRDFPLAKPARSAYR